LKRGLDKRVVAGIAVLFCLLMGAECLAGPKRALLPENYKVVQTGTQTVTLFLEEDNPEELAQKSTAIHEEYARKGWVLFQITPYVDDEDTEGLFLTYQKKE